MPNKKLAAFFAEMGKTALTYGDVRLETGFSDILPSDANLKSRFSRNVGLNIPIIAASMDTVTERRMAVAMATQGGIGIIHKNLTPEDQAKAVKRVKLHLNGRVETPITVEPSMTLVDVERMRSEKRFDFKTFPVVNAEGKLVGMLSGSDFRFAGNLDISVANAMTEWNDAFLSGSTKTTPEEALVAMRKAKKNVMPLLEDGEVVGMYVFSDLQRIFSGDSTHNVDKDGHLIAAAAMGVGETEYHRAELLVTAGCDVLRIDTAHGNSAKVIETIKWLKGNFPETDVVAGNVSHHNAVKRLADVGVDGIMVGQGPGSICTTRTQAGIGCPQVTAVYRCAVEAEKFDIPVCADGGIQHPGDITIALGIGASSVMLGSVLAGTDASPGDVITHKGREMKYYRGMGSLAAMLDNAGSRARYGQSDTKSNKLVAEGIEGMVPYKGPLAGVLNEYLGGLRSGMGYVGAHDIPKLQEKADLLHITNAGLAESHPHDITQI